MRAFSVAFRTVSTAALTVAALMAADPTKLTNARHRLFVDAYVREPNATKAAIAAGYKKKTAAAQGSALLRNPKVRGALDARLEKHEQQADLKKQDVLRELAKIGTSDIRKAFDDKGCLLDIHKLPDELAPAISSIEVESYFDAERGETVTTKKVKFWEKTKALELYMKHLGLLIEKHEVKATVLSFEQMVLESMKGTAKPAEPPAPPGGGA